MEEIWADIKGYEGLYQVSNLGRVKSLAKIVARGRLQGERILKPGIDKTGYQRVNLYKNGKHKRYSVHRLVLTAFKPVDNMNNLDVNHKDEVKTNNTLENLEWMTHKENNNYGTRTARTSLPVVQLTLDGKLVNIWRSSHEAEREGGYHPGNINSCCKNKFHRPGNNIYKGYRWCYLHEYLHKRHPAISTLILNNREYTFDI